MEPQIKDGTDPIPFVRTKFAERVWQTIEYARKYNKITFIFGESQIGKTAAIEEYVARNSGTAHYVRMPSSPTLRSFVWRFAKRLGATRRRMSLNEHREYIMDTLTPNDVVVIDEAHQAILTDRNITVSHAKIFEFLREVYDYARCGLTLCSTNVFEDEMTGGSLAGVLEQCSRRSLVTFHCPKLPRADALRAFAKAFGLPEITEAAKVVQNDVIKSERLGVWLTILRMARGIATAQGREITWDDVVLAKRERDNYNAKFDC